MTIRFVQEKDIEHIIELCALHATYEKAIYNKQDKKEALAVQLFKHNTLKCLVVEIDNTLVGYATFMKQFSTWNADFYLYLDCLFLKETIRGKGIGRLLMHNIKDYAKSNGCTHVEWQTPYFNKSAIVFYEKLGAKHKTKERFFMSV